MSKLAKSTVVGRYGRKSCTSGYDPYADKEGLRRSTRANVKEEVKLAHKQGSWHGIAISSRSRRPA